MGPPAAMDVVGGEAEVVAAFADINEDLKDKQDLLEKCQSMINHLGLSARQLANEWEAHALNRGADDASQALLTLSSLGTLEAALSKRGAGSSKADNYNNNNATNTPSAAASLASKRGGPNPALSGSGGLRAPPQHSSSSSTPTFDAGSLPASEAALRKRLSMDGGGGNGNDILSPPPSSAKRLAPSTTPGAPFMSPPAGGLPTPAARPLAGALANGNGSSSGSNNPSNNPRATPSAISPGSLQSPPPQPSSLLPPGQAYRGRANAGQKVVEMNPNLKPQGGAVPPSKRYGGARCDLGVLSGPADINIKGRYRYMYTTLEERARAQEKALLRVQADLVERASLGELTPVGVPKQETVVVVGRVACEAAEGRINKASVLLEGSRRDSGGFRVKLDLNELPAFGLFPGQVLAVEGVNSSGLKMVVRRVLEGVPRPFATTPAHRMRELHHDGLYQGGAPLSLLVASGPFTPSDSLEYEPLEDLMKVIALKKPDVVVLAGPFVDANHPKVASGETELAGATAEQEGSAGETVDFESLFKMRVSFLLEDLFAQHPDLPTRVVLVPSLNDVFHDHVFPQPPLADRVPGGVPSPWFEDERIGDLGLPFANEADGDGRRVFCMSNPAIFTVNEVTVGITTNDILFHLSGDEVSSNVGNRLARLAAHLVQQQSFYPLFPPPPATIEGGQGMGAQLDFRHAEHWRLPVTPDVLLLPSKLAPFAKDVMGSLCLNPGSLTKSTSGGTYALLHINPIPEARLDAMAGGAQGGDTPIAHAVASRTHVEIIRI